MRPHTLLVALSILSLTTAAAFGQTLGAVLTGAGEVPPTTSPGFGNATVTFDSTRQNITVTITVTNLGSPIIAAHIHEAPAGQPGNVVIGFTPLSSFVNGKLTGTFPIASDVAQRMLQNPSNFYVNVHTDQFPNGAVRGQLAYVNGGPITYVAELRPQNEVPPATSTAFGSAFVTLDLINNTIAWEVNSKGVVSPTLSHIHRGPAGVAGPVIINFATGPSQIVNGHTSGSGTIAAQQTSNLQASDLLNLANPGTAIGYYVNLHSTAFPGGEIRGALVPANEYDLAVAGRTTGVGTVFVTDARVFNPSYDTPAAALLEYFQAGSTANAVATKSMAISIPPRGTAILDDVAGPNGLDVSGTAGAIRVSSATVLAVTSRIYSDQRSSGKGTFGQFVPAQARANALRRGVMPQLANQVNLGGGFRTNIGFFNPNTAAVTVRLELRDDAGALVGTSNLTLQALSQQQNSIATYFPGVDLNNALNLTLSFDASAPIDAYASVIDNVSTDPIFVPAQQDAGVAASQ